MNFFSCFRFLGIHRRHGMLNKKRLVFLTSKNLYNQCGLKTSNFNHKCPLTTSKSPEILESNVVSKSVIFNPLLPPHHFVVFLLSKIGKFRPPPPQTRNIVYAEAQSSRWWCVDLQQTNLVSAVSPGASKPRPQNLPPFPVTMGSWRVDLATPSGI